VRTIVWFRGKDLRVADHAPLTDALAQGDVIPLFVLDPYFFAPERARELPHRMQFLLESIRELVETIAALGSRLVVAQGKSVDVVPALAQAWKADRVVAQRWTEPFARERDRRIQDALNVPFVLFEGETIAAPDAVRTGEGRTFSVFTPFSRAFREHVRVGRVLPPPTALPPLLPDVTTPSTPLPSLSELGISYNPQLLRGGMRASEVRLRHFFGTSAPRYDVERDRLDLGATSRLSQDLKFGTLSARAVWARATAALARSAPRALESFQNELLWREFAHATLWARPELLKVPFRSAFAAFPYQDDASAWAAWVTGTTGYPVVDASARQLLTEGFVHNRARMISASFLTKHLLVDYRRGEAHYLKYLTDGDWAQNNAGWQWSAGSGADAQPYFRVFNPVLQGEKFDPDGTYVRRYVPELAKLPARYVHAPWRAPADVLRSAGVRLGEDYPRPIVDHGTARTRFLALAETLTLARVSST
jgi:deoxyribodipyrimidine photo-lyase